jgi:uncharacterized protein involved in exopolysaccharide biosynthesis
MSDRIDVQANAEGQGAGPGPLRSHAIFITVFVLSTIITSLVMTYVYSERYSAEATIFFKPANILKLSENQVRALGSPVPYTPFKVIGQTLSGLAKSEALLRQVVLDLKLDVPTPKIRSPIWYIRLYEEVKDWVSDYGSDAWSLLKYGRVIRADPVDEAIADVRRGLKILNEDSYVFTLTARYKDPDAAAAIANHIAKLLADLLRQDDRTTADQDHRHLRELLTAKFDETTALEKQIRDLFLTNQVGSVDAAIKQGTSAYSKLELTRADVRAELSRQEARLAVLANKVRQYAPTAQTAAFGASDDPLQSRLAGRLTTNEYATLSLERETTEVNVNGLRSRIASYDQKAVQMQQELAKLTGVQAEYGLLTQRLQASKRDYAALRDALAESTIRAGDSQSELRVTSAATAIYAPVSPIKFYHVGLALIVAAMLACGLAFVLDYFEIGLFLPRPRRRKELSDPERPPTNTAAGTAHPMPAAE